MNASGLLALLAAALCAGCVHALAAGRGPVTVSTVPWPHRTHLTYLAYYDPALALVAAREAMVQAGFPPCASTGPGFEIECVRKDDKGEDRVFVAVQCLEVPGKVEVLADFARFERVLGYNDLVRIDSPSDPRFDKVRNSLNALPPPGPSAAPGT